MFHYQLWMAFRASFAGILSPRWATPAEQWRCGAKFATEARIPTDLRRTQANNDEYSRTVSENTRGKPFLIEPLWPSVTSSALEHSGMKFRRYGSLLSGWFGLM